MSESETVNKTCRNCHCTKPVAMFPKNGKDTLGTQLYRKECKMCYNITRKATCKKGRVTHRKFVASMTTRTGEAAPLSLQEWKNCMIYFGGRCAYCGIPQSRTVKITKDHLIPCVAGGTTAVDNVVPACKKCNSSKGSKYLSDWYPYILWYSEKRMKKIVDYVREVRT